MVSVNAMIFVVECVIKLGLFEKKWRIKRSDPIVVTIMWLTRSHRFGVVAPTIISHRPEIMPIINKIIAVFPVYFIWEYDLLINKIKDGINPTPIKMWMKTFEM